MICQSTVSARVCCSDAGAPSSAHGYVFIRTLVVFFNPLTPNDAFRRHNRGFPKVRHHHSNACGRHFVWVQIRAYTVLDCTITTIMNTSLYVDGIPGAFPTKIHGLLLYKKIKKISIEIKRM